MRAAQLSLVDGGQLRRCAWDPEHEIEPDARADAKFCSVVCRKRSWRFHHAAGVTARPAPGPYPMRFAYADPPYPGRAFYYRDHPDFAGEVNHASLLEQLQHEGYDGWALSTSSDALQDVLALCPPGVRVCSWHRRVRRVKAVHPLASWEPLIVYAGRPYPTERTQQHTDRLVYEGRYGSFPGALIGMKPPQYALWVFQQLNARPGDELVDLFPGSSAVARAWGIYSGAETTTVPRVSHETVPRTALSVR